VLAVSGWGKVCEWSVRNVSEDGEDHENHTDHNHAASGKGNGREGAAFGLRQGEANAHIGEDRQGEDEHWVASNADQEMSMHEMVKRTLSATARAIPSSHLIETALGIKAVLGGIEVEEDESTEREQEDAPQQPEMFLVARSDCRGRLHDEELFECAFYLGLVQHNESPDANGDTNHTAATREAGNHGQNIGSHG
jgi:hypothetical protein